MKKLLLPFIGVLMLAGTTQYYCPKCQSEDISITMNAPIERQKPKRSMDEFTMANVITLEYRTTTYVLICNKCGYKVEVTQ